MLFGQRTKIERIDEETGEVSDEWVSAFETCSWTDALNQMDSIVDGLRNDNTKESLMDRIRERMGEKSAA